MHIAAVQTERLADPQTGVQASSTIRKRSRALKAMAIMWRICSSLRSS
ncbi:hypothetical protein [Streptomyces sp. YIM B13518]